MGATSSSTRSQGEDDDMVETKEDRKKRRERKNLVENFFICVEAGAASQVQDLLRRCPTLVQESPPPTIPTLYNAQQTGQLHPIHIALNRNHYGVVKVLLDVDPESVNAYREPTMPWDYSPYGEYPLQTLLQAGHGTNAADIFRMLLDAKADVSCSKSKAKSAPVFLALRNGSVQWARTLLECQADIDAKTKPDIDASSSDILQVCLTYGSPQSTDLPGFLAILAERGFDMNRIGSTNEIALFPAIRSNNIPVIEALLKYKADVTSRDQYSASVLQVCMTSGANETIFSTLLAQGANPYESDQNGNTILHTLAQSHHVNNHNPSAFIQKILALGVDPEARNRDNYTALDIAQQYGYRDIVKAFLEQQVGLSSIENSPPALHPLLIRFAQNYWEQEVDVLLQLGVDVNLKSHVYPGYTALHMACCGTGYTMVQKLLEHGANPNLQDSNGDTALHMAVNYNSDITLIQALLDAGADVNIKNNSQLTAKAKAASFYNTQIKKMLEDAG